MIQKENIHIQSFDLNMKNNQTNATGYRVDSDLV